MTIKSRGLHHGVASKTMMKAERSCKIIAAVEWTQYQSHLLHLTKAFCCTF